MAGKLGLGHLETLLEGLNDRSLDLTDTELANVAAATFAETVGVTGITTCTGGLVATTAASNLLLNNFKYLTVAAGNLDYSTLDTGNYNILVNAAKADGTHIRLPEATTSNGGMHIRVILGIAVADDFAVGFVTSNIQGAAFAVGDTNEAASPAHATAIADTGDTFKSVRFNLDTAAAEIDAPTLADHFSTTVVTS